MQEITYDEFVDRYEAISSGWDHMEFRDGYGTARELPRFATWQETGIDDGAWLDNWCTKVSSIASAGRRLRRLKVVSDPVSSYHRWIASIVHRIDAAGESHRWCYRPATAGIPQPGADFYLLDDSAVIFLHFDAEGRPNGYTFTRVSETVELCRSAFETVWETATPHGEFALQLNR
ncbi:hypothetical protein GCM10010123_01020 [Pilimelia anulata]|uniref:DUF6879 domain-containing protein n=1 Tax=Pilimelia anulata TaxID=53371 RepID=A0A8J3B617_9ACTN|nr:DUF6879 family protein [Pilimelia anulata]GGJ74851.1 hypothetical protein GCM10010123_01020 [Pilimelia anulata]